MLRENEMGLIISVRRAMFLLGMMALLLLSGCATVHEMGLKKGDSQLELKGKGMVLMSMEISNQYKPDYQPQIIAAQIEKPGAKSKEDRDNFQTDLEGTVSSASGTRYLLRMELQPGHYIIRGALCSYHSFFVMASCQMPVHGDFIVEADKVTYLGRAVGVLRERQGEEFRAGPIVPLVDQAVAGFSGGTFDVTISDQQQEDLSSYKQQFPALRNQHIAIEVLSPFDRERAQLWWDSNGSEDKKTIQMVKGKGEVL